MNIKEAAQQSGLSEKSIRYYEAMDLLKVDRSSNGYRVYEEHQIERLKEINLFRSLHISIEAIKQYYEEDMSMDAFMATQMPMLQQKINELEESKQFCLKMQKNCTDRDFNTMDYYEKRNQMKGLRSEYQELTTRYLSETKNGKRWILLLAIWLLSGAFLFDANFFDGSLSMIIIFLEALLILSLLIYYHVLPVHKLILKVLGVLFQLDTFPEYLEKKLDRYFPNAYLVKKILVIFILLFILIAVLGLLIGLWMLISSLFNL